MNHYFNEEISNNIITLTLNRPRKGNSYNGEMAESLSLFFEKIKSRTDIKALIMRAKGKNFCTGADLHWMQESILLSDEDNILDMRKVLNMYQNLLEIKFPIVCLIQGKVRGGGLGLISCSDLAIALAGCDFALTEINWGLIPGIISPILIKRVGRDQFEQMYQSGKILTALEAEKLNLINKIIQEDEIEETLLTLLKQTIPTRKPSQDELSVLFQEMEIMLLESAKKRKKSANYFPLKTSKTLCT